MTGKEIARRKSKAVKEYRVDPSVYDAAYALLVDGVRVFVERWLLNQGSRNRLNCLVYACAVIDATSDLFSFEPSVFITELVKECDNAGQPLDLRLVQKMLDYSDGSICYELTRSDAKKALEEGSKAFKESVLSDAYSNG